MISAEQLARNREHIRAEGRKARSAGVEIMDCPYTPAAPKSDMFGVQLAVEWLNGWYEQDAIQ